MTDSSPLPGVQVTDLAELAASTRPLTLRRVDTSKGTRLEIATEHPRPARTRLDAVTLECLTFQPLETFEKLRSEYGPGDRPPSEPLVVWRAEIVDSPEHVQLPSGETNPLVERSRLTTITNEFAHVEVSRVATEQRTYLELAAPKVNSRTTLNGPALKGLIGTPITVFDGLIRDEIE